MVKAHLFTTTLGICSHWFVFAGFILIYTSPQIFYYPLSGRVILFGKYKASSCLLIFVSIAFFLVHIIIEFAHSTKYINFTFVNLKEVCINPFALGSCKGKHTQYICFFIFSLCFWAVSVSFSFVILFVFVNEDTYCYPHLLAKVGEQNFKVK